MKTTKEQTHLLGELGGILSASLLTEVVQNEHNFFLKCFVKFTSELVWADAVLECYSS
jgi:hypothetical protein